MKTEKPVGGEQKLLTCESKKDGPCVRHGSIMRQIMVTSKKWVDRGKGFGWKQTKSKKIICLDRNLPPVNLDMNLDNPGGERPTSQKLET